MSIVTLVSGGLDSTLMTVLAMEEKIEVYPLFLDYGQLACERELASCRRVFQNLQIPGPEVVNVAGIGKLVPCGLTSLDKKIYEEAFLPGRNLLFLLAGAAYAFRMNANSVAIGLLDESASIFPDQTKNFTNHAEKLLSQAIGQPICILTPLIKFTKNDVVTLAAAKGISGTYSCHAGQKEPCGICIACREFQTKEVK